MQEGRVEPGRSKEKKKPLTLAGRPPAAQAATSTTGGGLSN